MDGVTALAFILIGSFAVDRIVSGTLFVLSFNRKFARNYPDPEEIADPAARRAAEKERKLIYHLLAFDVAVVILGLFGGVRVLSAVLGPKMEINRVLDAIVTGLMLMGGADGLAQVLKLPGLPGGKEKAPAEQIQIVVKLSIEGRTDQTMLVPPATAPEERLPIIGA